MDYKKLPVILKRYSFDEKMRILMYYSLQLIDFNCLKINKNQPMPWELETFLMFSVKADEYQFKDFKGQNINNFSEIINCIRNYHHPFLLSKSETSEFVDYVLIAFGSTQYDCQSYDIYKYFRYNYFFNYTCPKISMKNEFYKKFGIEYKSVLEFGIILNFLFASKVSLNYKIIEYILLKYATVVKLLTISREEFKKEIDLFAENIEDYLYCVRPSDIYPFIKYGQKIYLPLPHCLTRAVTDSLLYRITDNQNDIRTLFGKDVLEAYLYDILLKSNLFTEIILEKEYIKNKNQLKTSDVMCRINNEYLFFECKSMVPYSKTRCMKEKSILDEINKISNAVVQLYKQIYLDFKRSYDFFENDDKTNFNRDNCFGIVVLLEESYIKRELIYKKVAEKLKINTSDRLYKWIINHIKVCSLYDVEKYAFTGTSIINSLKSQMVEYGSFDYPLVRATNTKLRNTDVKIFRKYVIDMYHQIIKELQAARLLM